MKPIQFHQNKLSWNWMTLEVSENVSHILYTVRDIKSKRPKWKNTKLRVATLLTEYYSILFNPEYQNYFRPMTDLTLLFPTNENIYISNDTNFILLPLPLPTYRQHVQWRFNDIKFRLKNPCPFLLRTTEAKELVHDMDYSRDNPCLSKKRISDQRNINNWLQHTNPDLKKEWFESTLDITWRIRVYQFRDLFPEQAKHISTFPRYNIWQRLEIKDIKVPSAESIQKPWMSPEEFRNKILNMKNSFIKLAEYNLYSHRQYTFLEITPPNKNPRLMNDTEWRLKFNNKLQNYCKYLEPEQLNINFAKQFNFKAPDKRAIINYFLDNMDWIEYSPAQIMSGIKRLKNIIKYKKPKILKKNTYTIPWDQQEVPEFNQHVRSLNIKQTDWSFQSQMFEDSNITKRTSLEDTKPLSINNNTND